MMGSRGSADSDGIDRMAGFLFSAAAVAVVVGFARINERQRSTRSGFRKVPGLPPNCLHKSFRSFSFMFPRSSTLGTPSVLLNDSAVEFRNCRMTVEVRVVIRTNGD